MSSVDGGQRVDLYDPAYSGLTYPETREAAFRMEKSGELTPPWPHEPIDVRTDSRYEHLDEEQQHVAKLSARLMNHYVSIGRINPENLSNVFDFGTGNGSASLIVAKLVEMSGAELVAVELDEEKAKKAVLRGVIPEESMHAGDGFKVMEQEIENGRSYDLITAIAFGPDNEHLDKGPLSERFFNLASKMLSREGIIVVTSDAPTMYNNRLEAKRNPNIDIVDVVNPNDMSTNMAYTASFRITAT